ALWEEKELPLPLIAHVIIDNKYPHYVVIYGIKDTELLISDPGRGKLKKSVIEFNEEWRGVVLILTPKEIYQTTKEKIASLKSFLTLI
ncbi:cysteine peptidase family C39 domain-containing protein, partial [Enterococcus faecium]|uniref:cysteine peptidase family C39 domain-containing protein n=1 Tax=Enterococcus faecium TaxID=1352 RepID=UPI00217E321C